MRSIQLVGLTDGGETAVGFSADAGAKTEACSRQMLAGLPGTTPAQVNRRMAIGAPPRSGLGTE